MSRCGEGEEKKGLFLFLGGTRRRAFLLKICHWPLFGSNHFLSGGGGVGSAGNRGEEREGGRRDGWALFFFSPFGVGEQEKRKGYTFGPVDGRRLFGG